MNIYQVALVWRQQKGLYAFESSDQALAVASLQFTPSI